MANSHRSSVPYGATPYRSREGLSTRVVSNSDEIQLWIDPMHVDLDEEIMGLHRKINLLKNVQSLQPSFQQGDPEYCSTMDGLSYVVRNQGFKQLFAGLSINYMKHKCTALAI